MVIFLSDIHLGAGYLTDSRATEKLAIDVLEKYGSKCSEIFLLGDIIDYWFEYRYVVPKGFVRFFGELASLTDRGVKITWLTGNHDIWIKDYFTKELGITVIDAPYIMRVIEGKRFLLAHGDRIGSQKPGFRFISKLFRNRLCQKAYAALHPGLTMGFAHWWSNRSRKQGKDFNIDSAEIDQRVAADISELCKAETGLDFIIEGHLHHPYQCRLDSGAVLTVLGDWAKKPSFALFKKGELELKDEL